jgi:MarR family transcriptional regulator for hemolysin
MSDRTKAQQSIASNLLRLARLYRREVNRALGEHAISDARAVPVLQIARSGGGMRQGVLAEELGLEGPSLVRLLDQLSAAGLVERCDDPTDRRAKTLRVTDEGATLAAAIEAILAELRDRLMAQISDDDLAATVRTFAALTAALEATDPPAGHD